MSPFAEWKVNSETGPKLCSVASAHSCASLQNSAGLRAAYKGVRHFTPLQHNFSTMYHCAGMPAGENCHRGKEEVGSLSGVGSESLSVITAVGCPLCRALSSSVERAESLLILPTRYIRYKVFPRGYSYEYIRVYECEYFCVPLTSVKV